MPLLRPLQARWTGCRSVNLGQKIPGQKAALALGGRSFPTVEKNCLHFFNKRRLYRHVGASARCYVKGSVVKTALAVAFRTSIPLLLGVVGTLIATMAPTYYSALCGG